MLTEMTEVQRALIRSWAHACWTDVALSLSRGKVQKPDHMGGSFRSDAEAAILVPATNFTADGSSIRAGLILPDSGTFKQADYKNLQWHHTCTWVAVQTWLRQWTVADREAMQAAYEGFYAVYLQRPDEAYKPWNYREAREAATARYESRMNDGGYAAMDGYRAEAERLINRNLDEPQGVAVPVQMDLFETAGAA